MSDSPAWGLPYNFAGLEPEQSALESSRVAILPVPYDFSTSYQGGARWGPQAILAASRNMETWDDELGAISRAGIHTLPELEPAGHPGRLAQHGDVGRRAGRDLSGRHPHPARAGAHRARPGGDGDRKSTRLNSSHRT